MLDEVELSPRATGRLTALFAWARFSVHDVRPEMKDEAIETLEQVQQELAAAEAAREAQLAGALGVKRIDRAIAFGLAVTAWAGIVLVLVPGRASVVGHVWLVVVLAIALGAALGALRRAAPRRAFRLRRGVRAARGARGPGPRRSTASSARSTLATGTAFDVHYRLRPPVRTLASGLLLRRGVDLERAPERAEALVGPERLGARSPRPCGAGRPHRARRSRSRRSSASSDDLERLAMELRQLAARAAAVLDEVERAVVGKRDRLELVLAGLLADGHVLLEDVPGLAKTLTARSFATVTGLRFSRVQFTPDLLPTDVTGSSIWNQRELDVRVPCRARSSRTSSSPTRSTAPRRRRRRRCSRRCRSARSRSTGRRTLLEPPFLVLATQNPIEYEGTYPLPEAQLDRFVLRTGFGYPSADDEWEMLERRLERRVDEVELRQVVDRETLLEMQRAVEDVHVDESVGRYIVDLVAATRESPSVSVGLEPARLARARSSSRAAGRRSPGATSSRRTT